VQPNIIGSAGTGTAFMQHAKPCDTEWVSESLWSSCMQSGTLPKPCNKKHKVMHTSTVTSFFFFFFKQLGLFNVNGRAVLRRTVLAMQKRF